MDHFFPLIYKTNAGISGFEIRYAHIDLQPLAVHLLFIADSDQDDLSTHRGVFNYTLSPHARQ